MIDMEKVINELRFQLNSKEVKEHHDPIQLAVRDAEKILALLKEQEKPNGKCVNECECWDSAYERGKQDVLKEQEAMSWINVKDRLPNENGSYLVVYKAFQYAFVDVKRFAKDLYSVDEYDFPNEHRPGWYEYDDEYGYIERNDITHWMPLPNLPEKGR